MDTDKTPTIPVINFVKKDKTILRLQARRIYVIQTVSMFVLGVYAMVLILTFSYSAFLSYRTRVIDREITKEQKSVEEMATVEAKYLLVKQKLVAAMSNNRTTYRYQDLMESIFQLIPSDLVVDGFVVDEQNNILFTAKTNNPYSLDDLIKQIMQYNSVQSDSKLTDVVIKSINVDKEGTYTVSLSILVEYLSKS